MRWLGRILVSVLAAVGLFTLLALGLALWAAIGLKDKVEPPLPGRMVLTLDLEGSFQEAASAPFARFSGQRSYVLHEVVRALDQAAGDERVAGLFATLGNTPLDMAGAQEIRAAVKRFRDGGKSAVVFAETIGEAGNGTVETYLASAFDQIWLQPSGDVGMTGFLVESPFLKGTLEKLGIEPQFAARHEYKSAIEIFTEKGFSRPHRESVQALVDSWAVQAAEGIAEGRRIAPEAARALLGNGPLLASEALSAGLVDKLGYREDALAALLGTVRTEEIDLGRYAARTLGGGGTKVALIVGSGPIHRGPSDGFAGTEGFGSETVARAFRDAIEDSDVNAILFRVNSPGGSYVASDTIWHEVMRARAAGKPVVAWMGNVAASGGYFVAMGADRVIAQPGTVTGSIGVFAGKFVLKDMWDKLGISWGQISRGDNAGMWSFNEPFTERHWERLNLMVDHIYDDFTAKAAKGRGIDPERMDALARGRVWSGADARAAGLVDELGGFHEAMAALREVARIPADETVDLVPFPEPKTPFEMLAAALGEPAAADPAMRSLTRALKILEPVTRALEADVLSLPPGLEEAR